MLFSAHNQLQGTITAIKLGSVMAEVSIDLPGGQKITSTITRSSAESMNLKEGDQVVAIIKSTEVIVGKNE
jgi:molybdopterin-binding protein